MAKIFNSTVDNRFSEYKFSGDPSDPPDQEKAMAQLAHFSEVQKQVWQTSPTRIGLANTQLGGPSEADANQAIVTEIQTNFMHHMPPLEAITKKEEAAITEISNQLVSNKANSDQIINTIFTQSQHVRIHPLLLGLRAIAKQFVRITGAGTAHLKTEHLRQADRESLQKMIAKFLEGWQRMADHTSSELSLGIDSTQWQQLRQDLSSLKTTLSNYATALSAHSTNNQPKEIIFSAILNDPKRLLTIGDLVNAASCQNYRNGSHISTLPGYVIDANVLGMGTWVLGEKQFQRSADYRKLIAVLPMEGGATASADPTNSASQSNRLKQIQFNQALLQITFTFADGSEITTLPLGYAHRRRIIKTGAQNTTQNSAQHTAGIRMERAYSQPHPRVEASIQSQSNSLYQSFAQALGAATSGSPINISPSRNPGGVYSDGAGGAMKTGYQLP